MKNKIAYFFSFIVVVAVATVATTGCNKKFLEDMKSYEKFDTTMFKNEVLVGAYIDRLYNYYFASYKDPRSSLVGQYEAVRSQSTDELGGTVTKWINPNTTQNQASQADGYYGLAPQNVDNVPYTRIRFANYLIEQINEGIGSALSEDFKKRAKGQMYMFRALQYFDLARLYGGVPLVLKVQNASVDDEAIKLPRAKTSEVFDQVVLDLDSAAALLPWAWPSAGTDYGRFTSAFAIAMKSRVLLTAASPLFNPNWDNPGDQRWQKALAASLEAETKLSTGSPAYGTAIKTAKDWAEVTFKNDNAFNGEAIFAVLLSTELTSSTGANNSWENSVRLPDAKGTGGISAPKAMLDLFPLADGSRPVIGVNYNDTFFFEGRDPRFYRTFAFSGCKWPVKNNDKHVTWLYRWREGTKAASSYANNQGNSPAMVRKMSNPAADSLAFAQSGTDIFEYRYAELLMNIAECYAATGQIPQCLEYLKKVRQRVYPSALASTNFGLGTLANKYAALEACLYERRVELAYEGKRFWDLQRWMLYDDDASIGDNTNALLNIPKLNGTARQGYYWQQKTSTAKDLLTDVDRSIFIDPDAADFATQIGKLKALYIAKFQMTPLDNPWDKDGAAVNMNFRSNYYINGLNNSVLAADPWLTQTIGWQDYNGAMGTFDYRQ